MAEDVCDNMYLILTEENSQLKTNKYLIPNGVKTHLNKTLSSYKGDKTKDGYKRLNNLVGSSYVSYHELKRIKNFFDTFGGDKTDDEYVLNGGDAIRQWVEKTLSHERDRVKNDKEVMSKAGKSNAFIRKHTRLK